MHHSRLTFVQCIMAQTLSSLMTAEIMVYVVHSKCNTKHVKQLVSVISTDAFAVSCILSAVHYPE
jgi:hypothetical protein